MLDQTKQYNNHNLSQNALYRMSGLLFVHKEEIENHLAKREKELFALEEKIILQSPYLVNRFKINFPRK